MDVLEMAAYIARTMYTNEFCAVCGKAIMIDEAKNTTSSGSGENSAGRSVHKNCSSRPASEKTLSYSTNKH